MICPLCYAQTEKTEDGDRCPECGRLLALQKPRPLGLLFEAVKTVVWNGREYVKNEVTN